jgi:predicted GNAT superfamily acetyltransferase
MTSESAHALEAGPEAAGPDGLSTSSGQPLTVRRVETLAEYQECVAIQEETWGAGFMERVPASMLLVAQKLGGVVAGAFTPGGRICGFVFGMTGVMDGRLVHWSDLLAVRPEARGAGIGERLKRYQRDLVRAVGVETMRWTFDPLVARNAHLNLARLGARAAEYVPNMYGADTGSPLHGGIPTDRFVAVWDLTRREEPEPAAPRPPAGRPQSGQMAPAVVDAPDAGGAPVLNGMPDAPLVRVAVPHDVHALPIERRAAWRSATRAAFLEYLGRGYEVVGFRRGEGDELPYYELARGA